MTEQNQPPARKPAVSKPMFIALAVVSALVVIAFGVFVYLWMSQSQSKRQEIVVTAPAGPSAAKPVATPAAAPAAAAAVTTTKEEMQALAQRISAGDSSATTQLEVIAENLYRGINYQQERDRVMANLMLMKAAYDQLGADAGAGNKKAMDALKYSVKSRSHLRSFAPDALGVAAAAGNKEAMDILLNYKKNNILQSSAVGAMSKPALKNDPQAVKFLLDVMADDKSKALWSMATLGLKAAADAGNADAQAAMDKYDQYMADRNSR